MPVPAVEVVLQDTDLEKKIEAWHQQVSDLTDFWIEKFAPRYLADIQENWDDEGALVGGWAPNAPGYAAWKAQRYGAHLGVLELSLRLRGSLQWLGRDIGPEGVFRPMRDGVEIGTSVPYGRKHQYGEDGLPIREFLFFRDSPDYDQLWKDWIAERAQASGLETE